MSSIKEQKFNQACVDDKHDVIDAMLSQGYIPTSYNLTIACKQGDQLLVMKLLSYPDLDAQPGFIEAVKYNHLHLLDHLYTGIDVNKPDNHSYTALHWANDVEITRWLLDMGAKQIPNEYGNTPLHLACILNHVEKVELILPYMNKQGESIHILDNNKKTPIDIAKK